ncbi:hypothetical protein [Novosphingobium profundi]|uniref:hypothetical protein n=1 Tax=Novosphingobium profundi TaxID=1774954 RepID=UPI001CFD1B42|nr:hypothetical protein [Novosphingobium profundi]
MADFDPGIGHGATLALDTSVVINLHASGYGKEILSALPFNLVVSRIVFDELHRQSNRSSGERDFLGNAHKAGLIERIEMNDEEYEFFAKLVVVPPTLDDGEAATIAIALSRNFHPVVDERKGRARASALMTTRAPAWSLNLVGHPAVADRLGESIATEALYHALRRGRMRIAPKHADKIISLIGIELASQCTCLPGYKERFQTHTKPPTKDAKSLPHLSEETAPGD